LAGSTVKTFIRVIMFIATKIYGDCSPGPKSDVQYASRSRQERTK
jgi:hypothetical protein